MVYTTIPLAELVDLRATIATLQRALDRSHEQLREALATIERMNASQEQIVARAESDRQRFEHELAGMRARLEQQRAARTAKAVPVCNLPQASPEVLTAAAQPAANGATARRPILRLPSRL